MKFPLHELFALALETSINTWYGLRPKDPLRPPGNPGKAPKQIQGKEECARRRRQMEQSMRRKS